MSEYWSNLEHHTDVSDIWMSHPAVRAAINRRVTGDPNQWPLIALKRWLGARGPVENAVSIGCGVGGLERALVSEGIARDVTGVDMSQTAIEEARRLAGDACKYVVADARAYLEQRQDAFDAVFFHQSLHHFDDLDELLEIARFAIRPGGFLYLDEYIGPARDEWSIAKLLQPNLAYRKLPRAVRRPHLIRAPINYEDPTEAIRSSEIVPAVKRHFIVIDRRDYGGNLLAVVYPNLRRPSEGAPPEKFDAAVRRLIEMEDGLLQRGAESFYSVIVAQ